MLSDFGVSRIFGAGLSREVNATRTIVSNGKTESKLIMGTRGYMAPEVLKGEDATPAADVYSLGVMFFHLLTGLWYEPGTKALALLDGFKYQWRDVLSRMLSVNPQERPLPLSDLPRQLQQILPSEATTLMRPIQPPNRSRSLKRWWLAASIAIVLAAVAVGVVVAFRPATDGLPPPAQDDFGELFSASDVFRSEEGGK